MKKMLFVFPILAVLLMASSSLMAQSDRPAGEIYVGYQYLRDNGFASPKGFTIAGVANAGDYVGIKGDFGYSKESGFGSLLLQGGVQIKNNKKEGSKVRPFAHVMAGGIHYKLTDFYTDNYFAFTLGGGIDVQASPKVSIRLGQFDYIRLSQSGGNIFRISTGIVFR